MYGQRRRRWANIKPALGHRLVFAVASADGRILIAGMWTMVDWYQKRVKNTQQKQPASKLHTEYTQNPDNVDEKRRKRHYFDVP